MANTESSPEELQRQLELHCEKQRLMEEETKLLKEKLNEARKRMSQSHKHKRLQDGGKGRRATVTMPRSQSNMGYAMNRGDDQMQRSISLHSAPAHAMCRSVSSAAPESQMPFVQTGRVAPFPNVGTAMMLDHYIQSNEEAVNAQMVAMANRLPLVEEDPLADVGQDPADYLARIREEEYSPFSSQPHGQFLSASNDYYHHVPSDTPSLVSGTTAEAQSLSRQGSACTPSLDTLEMARIGSGHSQRADTMFTQDAFHANDYNSEYSLQSKSSLTAALLGVGTGASIGLESADMARSLSNSSSSSCRTDTSTASNQERRAKEARERQIENGKRTQIAPKPEDASKANSRSQSEAEKDGKLALSKNSYQRPKHPRVPCTQCTEYPEGFRGEHELRRHINAKHERKVKKFICRDPETVGITPSVRAVNPLSRCKQCVQKKKYGAYYNAAAHLRRTHFKPKLSRNKSKPTEAERRAGKAGGYWPEMSELKHWMEEVEVLASEDTVADANAEGDVEVKHPYIDPDADAFDSFDSLDATSPPGSILSSQGIAMSTGSGYEYGASLSPTSPVMSQIPSELSYSDYAPYPSMAPSNIATSPYHELFF